MARQNLEFVLNGVDYRVSRGLDASYNLAEFLRDQAGLRGTKVTCREGGCGACTVLLTRGDGQGKEETVSVNSCLVPIYGLHGAKVTTIEGLGGRKKGYHPVQRRLAEMHGSQCGYCSPGMVMSICGSLSSSGMFDQADVEKSLDGNLCRCTGYRPILDAAKSFISNSNCIDIEDLTRGKCAGTGDPDASNSMIKDKIESVRKTFQLHASPGVWFKTSSLTDVFDLLESNKTRPTKLVVGNTSCGVVKAWADVFIDIREVPELSDVTISDEFVKFGSNITLTSMINQLRKIGNLLSDFQYLNDDLVPHLESVGSSQIRNVGCWAGNLMMQHTFQEFPSDLVPPFDAVGATLVVASKDSLQHVTVEEFLDMDMNNRLILSISLPPLKRNQKFGVFKVKAREASSHSYVTGGFRMKLSSSETVEDIRVGYIGLRKGFVRASQLEDFMLGKCVTDQQVIVDALKALEAEAKAKVESNGILTDPEFRTKLAIHLFYKFVVHCLDSDMNQALLNGLHLSPRGLSGGTQDYQEKGQNFPLNQALPNVTALKQTAGETCYTDDVLRQEGELIAVIAPSQQAKARIAKIDTTEAKKVDGVHAILLASDLNPLQGQKVLANDKVNFAGEPIAVVLANDERAARRAGRMIEVTYADVETPIIDLREAIQKENFHSDVFKPVSKGDAEVALSKCDHIVDGECYMDGQYHGYMENHAALVVPTDEGFDVWSATQFPTQVQSEVAKAVGVSSNCVNVTVTQLGGGFGGKGMNPTPLAVITALSAKHCGRPVRLSMSLKNCMESTSKRFAFFGRYTVGFNKCGKILAVHAHLFADLGCRMVFMSDRLVTNAMENFDGCRSIVFAKANLTLVQSPYSSGDQAYSIDNILVEGTAVRTDKQPPTAMRAPIKYPVAIMMDNIMAKVAHHLNKPIWEVQERNFYRNKMMTLAKRELQECTIEEVWEIMKTTAQLKDWQKEIGQFNQTHRWIKRGLATSTCSYSIGFNPIFQYPAYVAVYASDGSVAVAHGGVEMGQGINTKVTQMVAKILGVPMDLIKIKATNVVTGNNAFASAGSLTMELLTKTVKDCCTILYERIRPFREKMPGKSWADVITACYFGKVDLSAHSRHIEGPETEYKVYSALAAEAEVDILTGERRINRVDIVFDCGESMNPAIDVGQIEGALVMSLGHMLFEKEVYDPKTGRLLSNTTWDYKLPTCMDIPTKMNIRLLKDTNHTLGVLPAKAIGEPPMCMAAGFQLAVAKAIEASRLSRGKPGFVQIDIPATADRVLKACQTEMKELTF